MKKLIFTIIFLLFASVGYCGTVTSTLDAGEEFSSAFTPIEVDDWQVKTAVHCNLSITGDWSGVLTLRRKFPNDEDWANPERIVETFSSNEETYIIEGVKDVDYQIGFSTGDYSSGSAVVTFVKD